MRIYRFLKKNKAILNSILVAVFSSLFFNVISDIEGDVSDVDAIMLQLFNVDTVAGILIIAALALLIVINLGILVWDLILNHYVLNNKFHEIMLAHTSSRIRDSIVSGSFSWGEDKTVEISANILRGWKPENVVVSKYIDEMYSFPIQEDKFWDNKSYIFNNEDYKEFFETESFQQIIKAGNNQPRFMLKACKPNFNKEKNELQLFMGRTEWSYCQYVWQKFGKNDQLMKEYSKGIISGLNSEDMIPNSLCMHIIMETKDEKIVLAKISQTKFNDKPGTWAVTLGEQVEDLDFAGGNGFYADFIQRGVRRAFSEEYRIEGDMYNDIVHERNIRVLALDFEGDIYNFTLVCCVPLNCKFDYFLELQKERLITAEATELKSLNYEEIPRILMSYTEDQTEYHPSSYLRLMLMYMHRYGIDRLQREIIKLNK